ncbi:MAG TPA: cytochrome c [Gemmatimonadaceae bacterium]|nr:cytochrome c [Gemmatimonadaceae bacterium]
MRHPCCLGAVSAVLVLAACGDGPAMSGAEPARRYGLGRTAAQEEITARNVAVGPGGEGLPAGSGSVAEGAMIYARKCASCHGTKGEGIAPAYPAIVGRDPGTEHFAFSKDWKAPRTIGNYWPYATTVFDYVRRAMPHAAPGSLTDNEVYAVTAWLLAANQVIAADARLDAKSLAAVKMPYQGRFVPDNRRGGRGLK